MQKLAYIRCKSAIEYIIMLCVPKIKKIKLQSLKKNIKFALYKNKYDNIKIK